MILDRLGELDRVVACTKYCADVVSSVADGSRLILADSWTADAKQIIAAHPDLVIAAVPYQEKAVSEILKAGSRFLGLAPRTLADIYADIATIGGIVGASDRAEQVIATMQRHIERTRERTANHPKPSVFCEEWGKPVIASQPWVAELVDPLAEFSRRSPAEPFPRMNSHPSIRMSSSRHGAGLGIASHCSASSPIGDGNRPQPRARAASSVSATNS